MATPNFVLLYCANPEASTHFYAELLQRQPVEQSPTFALFALDHGLMLGLWARSGVLPPAGPDSAAAHELAMAVDSHAAVQQHHQDWMARGLPVLQAPTTLDFGYTAVTADPDGHRLRVFFPGE